MGGGIFGLSYIGCQVTWSLVVLKFMNLGTAPVIYEVIVPLSSGR